jgi:oxygen-independent coproporphyrinogen-3 oxidase
MCYDELRFADIERQFGIGFEDYFATELGLLQPQANDGLVDITADAIRITPKGRLLLRSVAMVFDRYLREADEQRYSKAI